MSRQQVAIIVWRIGCEKPVSAMRHRATLGRHAFEMPYLAVSNRASCNGCSVSLWAHQTSKGSRLPHDSSTARAVSRPRASSEVPALARAELATVNSCYMHCMPWQEREPAQLSGLFCAQAKWCRQCKGPLDGRVSEELVEV